MTIGGNKGSSSGTSSQQTSQNSTSNYTPNNLAALQAGWKVGGDVLNSQNWGNLLGQGVSSTTGGVSGAAPVNAAASGAATNFANGNYVNNPANSYLTPYANGSQVGTANPGFQGMVGQISNALQPQIDGNFAAAGRYGSGANANAFASALTNATGNLAYQNYGQQQQNQLSAADVLSGNYNTGRNQQLAGAGLTPGLVNSQLAPGQALSGLAFSGPANYQNLLAAGGNPGGTTANSGTGTSNGTYSGNTNNMNFGLKFA